MKKVLSLILAILMLVSSATLLFSCGGGEEEKKGGCGSTLSMSCGLLTLAGAAMLLKKKRK